ncbi:unnamed protein product [Rotaria socialis]|uniref:BZIP domain-containing protein n=2 Tax=Rotaria socialis TaxID=392032 RepID=A0A820Y3U9_9BILA|nr:unnamed protein product [Rotaria socialis]CAF3459190.1 unnamed protein product [Rotaria socialis]CAF3581440.1 unnamed protein product [Rotaria socialis]CAF4221012.1 unnamed protein product [Rotaria socialis]CAF4537316.1 unnamed protein product [Rotaria socialis]
MKQHNQPTHSNLIKPPLATLTRLNSTSASTVILDEEMMHDGPMHVPLTLSANCHIPLRSVLKTSGLFNKDAESSDKLDEFFANGNEFTLHRLLSDINSADLNIDMNEIAKFDPMKLFETRSLSELFQCDSFDPINISSDSPSNQVDSVLPSAIACSSGSFSELYPPTPELPVKQEFYADSNQLKMEPDNALVYAQLNTLDSFTPTQSISTPTTQQFNFDPSVLAAFEHDYGFLSKRSTVVDTPSPSPTISKRTPSARRSCRTSSRLQSRATLIDFNQILNESDCLSPTMSEDSSISLKRTKNARQVNRATDIQTADDLSYYLERRRKNNEASKMSRAARKQKFGDMDSRCAEYERVNVELHLKISVLETVTANLKNGLIHSFQRKGGV